MIHLLRLIMLQISSSTNSDKIKIAKENNLQDSSETKLVFFGITGIIIAYIVYIVATTNLLPLKYNALVFSYIIAVAITLVNSISSIKEILLYKVEDDFLFSLPLTSTEIIISKLFMPYIKNLIYTIIIMFPTFYALKNTVNLNETSYLISILAGITLPIIPIIIGTIYAFIDSYYKKGLKKNIAKIFIIALLFLIVILLFRGGNNSPNTIIKKLSFLNPFIYLFKESLISNNPITTLLLIFLPIILFSLFIKKLSINYNYLLSRIKGVKTNTNKKVRPGRRKRYLTSLIHKDIISLVNNKPYFRSSLYLSIVLSISFLIISVIINTESLAKTHNFGYYLMLFLSFVAAISCTTINSLSLEKNNIIYFKSLPIRFYKLLLSKYLVNLLTSLPVILINFIVAFIFYSPNLITSVVLIINPVLFTTFISLLGLVLDFRFINYKEKDSNVIIKNRIITYIPLLVNIIVICSMFIINSVDNYKVLLLVFTATNILLIILTLMYLLINYKRIYNTNLR